MLSKVMKFDNFMFLLSLGTEVEDVHDMHDQGYMITYTNGDYCNEVKELRFKSKVNHICDPSVKIPRYMLTQHPDNLHAPETQEDCTFHFEVRSKYACTTCREE